MHLVKTMFKNGATAANDFSKQISILNHFNSLAPVKLILSRFFNIAKTLMHIVRLNK